MDGRTDGTDLIVEKIRLQKLLMKFENYLLIFFSCLGRQWQKSCLEKESQVKIVHYYLGNVNLCNVEIICFKGTILPRILYLYISLFSSEATL